MASQTEKQLQQMINVQLRIEKMLETVVDKKKDKGAQPVSTEISTEFVNIAASLQSIDKEAKQTNVLLKELIAAQTYTSQETAKDISAAAKAMESMGGGVEKVVQVAKEAGSISDSEIDSFRKIILITAFINPEDGKALVDDKHLEAAARATEGIMNIAKGIALMGLTMVLMSFVLPQIMKGSIGFITVVASIALSIIMVGQALKYSGGGFEKDSPVNALTDMVKAVAMAGLTMVLMSYVIPQILVGAIGFITVISTLTLGLYLMSLVLQTGDGGFKDTSPLHALKGLAVAIAAFALVFVLMSYVLPQIAKGALGFLTIIGALSIGLALLNIFLGTEKNRNTPLETLWKLSIGIAAFALVFVLLNLAWKYIEPGLTNFLWMMGALTIGLGVFSFVVGMGKQGSTPIDSLKNAAIGIAILSVVMIAIGYFEKPFWTGAKLLSITLVMLAGGMLLMGLETTQKGLKSLRKLSVDLLIFTGAMFVWATLVAPKLSWEAIGKLATVIGVMGLIGTVLGLPKINDMVNNGAKSLMLLGIALAIFAGGLAVYANFAAPKLTWEKLGMLGATITLMGLVGTVLGIPPIAGFVIAGAAGLIVLGIALITFSLGLSVFAKSGFKEKDSKSLNSALRATMAGFLGYKDLEEVGIGALIKVPLMISGLLAAGVAMIPISLSLLVLTGALKVFKKIKWTPKDSISLNSAITSVTKGLDDALKDVSWVTLWFGINSLQNVGSVLTGLAEGIQAFANLSFNEYAYDAKSGKLRLVNKVKLSPADITATGVSIGKVISAVTKPIAEFGEQMMGGKGSGFLGVNWGRMIAMQFGISSLQGIGTGLSNMAEGVKDWANLSVTEWGIQQNKQTGLNQLVPIAKKKISQSDIQKATYNIGYVLSGIARPLSEFGKIFTSEEKGWFGTNFQVENKGLKYGIKGMASLGKGLVNMATGVAKWANMEYTEYGIGVDKNTGLNVIMPIATKKISRSAIEKASYNIGYVLSALVYPLSEFGKIFTTKEEGWFGSEYNVTNEGLIEGIKQMANIGTGLSKMADMVAKWGNLQYTEMEVYTDSKGRTKIQPKAIKKISESQIFKATKNIGLVLSAMAKAFVNYHNELSKSGWSLMITEEMKQLGRTQKMLGGLASFITSKWGSGKMEKAAMSYKMWLYNVADPIVGKMLKRYKGLGDSIGYFNQRFRDFSSPVKSMAFSAFTSNIIKLSKYASPFEKFANAFNKMSVSMGAFAKNFKIMSPEGIKAFTVWTDTLVKAIQVGKDAEKGAFNKFLKTSEGAMESAFQFGKNQLGTNKEPTSTGEKKSIIDETIKGKAPKGKDPKNDALLNAIKALQDEVSGLKSAIGGTLNVNIARVNSSASIKINQ